MLNIFIVILFVAAIDVRIPSSTSGRIRHRRRDDFNRRNASDEDTNNPVWVGHDIPYEPEIHNQRNNGRHVIEQYPFDEQTMLTSTVVITSTVPQITQTVTAQPPTVTQSTLLDPFLATTSSTSYQVFTPTQAIVSFSTSSPSNNQSSVSPFSTMSQILVTPMSYGGVVNNPLTSIINSLLSDLLYSQDEPVSFLLNAATSTLISNINIDSMNVANTETQTFTNIFPYSLATQTFSINSQDLLLQPNNGTTRYFDSATFYVIFLAIFVAVLV